MILTFEFFSGIFIAFFIGYLLSILLEKLLHINLDNSIRYG
jgi:F0F1-type ATP synthase assembly protein I